MKTGLVPEDSLDEPVYDLPRDEMLQFIPVGARRILDVGCGTGRFPQLVRERRPGVEVWAVEADVQSAAMARTRANRVLEGLFPRDTAADLVGEQFDCILFNDVLEHMVSPTEAVDAARALLAPAGVVVASIPNVRHWSVIWPLLRHGSFQYEKWGILDRTHLRFFTKATAQALFTERGWHIQRSQGINRRTHWSKRDSRRLQLIGQMSRGWTDEFFWSQYVVVADMAR